MFDSAPVGASSNAVFCLRRGTPRKKWFRNHACEAPKAWPRHFIFSARLKSDDTIMPECSTKTSPIIRFGHWSGQS